MIQRNRPWRVLAVLAFAAGSATQAFGISVTRFGPGVWGASDATIGVEGFVIEDFEDSTLVEGLQIELTGSTAPYWPSSVLPRVIDPAVDDPNSLKVFTAGVWDGSRVLLNRKNPIPNGYVDYEWGDLVLHFDSGAKAVGFSVENLELFASLKVNGQTVGHLSQILGISSGRNGYVRINAAPNELIHFVTIDNATNWMTADAIAIDHLAFLPAVIAPIPSAACLSLSILGVLGVTRAVRRNRVAGNS